MQDAEKWARQTEVELDKNTYSNTTLAEKTTFKDLIKRYILEVTPTMPSSKKDTIRLQAIARKPISQTNMLALTPLQIAAYKDERLKEVSSGTVIRELCYFSSIINHARREWGININNLVSLVRKPPQPKGKTYSILASKFIFNGTDNEIILERHLKAQKKSTPAGGTMPV